MGYFRTSGANPRPLPSSAVVDSVQAADAGVPPMTVAKSVALFALAAIFEIGGAWLVWQAARDVAGAIVRLLGVAVIMYGPPGH